jgi:ferrochelatase
MMATLVQRALDEFRTSDHDSVLTVFTAHSLPQRIREWNDPYEDELRASAAAVAARVGLSDWRFAWQSAGGTREPWLGPDILEYLETLTEEGIRNVLQVPIGFVADHLEILYDIDIEAVERARSLGMTLRRTDLPNASPELIETLVRVVERAERQADGRTGGGEDRTS